MQLTKAELKIILEALQFCQGYNAKIRRDNAAPNWIKPAEKDQWFAFLVARAKATTSLIAKLKGSPPKPGNAIQLIHPYKAWGKWVFDDARFGLVKEPFVSGADTVITQLVKATGAKKGFALAFSDKPLPDAHAVLKREGKGSRTEGTWYVMMPELTFRAWLCPAMFHYFPKGAPKTIWVRVEQGKR